MLTFRKSNMVTFATGIYSELCITQKLNSEATKTLEIRLFRVYVMLDYVVKISLDLLCILIHYFLCYQELQNGII